MWVKQSLVSPPTRERPQRVGKHAKKPPSTVCLKRCHGAASSHSVARLLRSKLSVSHRKHSRFSLTLCTITAQSLAPVRPSNPASPHTCLRLGGMPASTHLASFLVQLRQLLLVPNPHLSHLLLQSVAATRVRRTATGHRDTLDNTPTSDSTHQHALHSPGLVASLNIIFVGLVTLR